MLTIEDVKQVSFRKAGLGGYKPEDVDAFIDQVLITMEQLKKEKSDLVKKMDILATRVEEYRADEDAVRNAMLASQRVADSTIKSAKAKAAQIIEESENTAKAKLFDLNLQIKEQKKQYALLLSECNKLREELISVCNKHIISAKELPSKTKVDIIEKQLEEKFPTDNSDEVERADEVMRAPVAEIKVEETTVEAQQEQAKEINPEVTVDNTTVVESTENVNVAEFFNSEVNLIEDISNAPAQGDANSTEKKKKSKLFSALKFGDDYNIDDDNDNDK
ncbi:MAG: DivIVA domain-containing protein [Clostridia bacterium]|nr:DivIVA domain-containing protein [Clostridia bacterium]